MRISLMGPAAIERRISQIQSKIDGVTPTPPKKNFKDFLAEINGQGSVAPLSTMAGEIRPVSGGPFEQMADAAALQHGIDPAVFRALVNQESGWDPSARNKDSGALGLTQLMPGTAAELGVNPLNPKENLDGGARYLKQMLNRFGTYSLALAAFNAGPGKVEKFGGIPNYGETTNYVKSIMAASGRSDNP